MENIEDVLPQIRDKLKNFYWKDIYNTDEKDLFYHLQADLSLDTKAIRRSKKKTRKDLLLWSVVIEMVQIKCLSGLLVSLLILDALNM
ncbi:hypothetical protein Godav_020821 [Gossypium davidsonii]|uniref:Uncharacterized protein n=1 Tax=Gossypium davidsonii TaxID=34287 RepID=A0A7J8R450_GOSDV|nr:hypothetical protein [Gossypium davidsonii]